MSEYAISPYTAHLSATVRLRSSLRYWHHLQLRPCTSRRTSFRATILSPTPQMIEIEQLVHCVENDATKLEKLDCDLNLSPNQEAQIDKNDSPKRRISRSFPILRVPTPDFRVQIFSGAQQSSFQVAHLRSRVQPIPKFVCTVRPSHPGLQAGRFLQSTQPTRAWGRRPHRRISARHTSVLPKEPNWKQAAAR